MSNLLSWCLQVLVVAAGGALLPFVFRLKAPRARLWYWQVLLLSCLLLPLVQPWLQPVPTPSKIAVFTAQSRVVPAPHVSAPHFSWITALTMLLAAGIVLRLVLLAVGLVRLRRYSDTAAPLESANEFEDLRRSIAPEAEILFSDSVSSPVTFGIWNAVVLLPRRFLELGRAEQRAIVCHELIHIRRRDWALTIGEELIRAVLWFHPAVWWLLGQIHLTREQVVDEAVIQSTGDRNRYLDALLAIASLRLRADLAPAPLFLKKRHLRQRVESIVTGVSMTKRTLLIPLAAALATLPVVIGVATWQFPLHAAEVTDDPGVELQLGSAKILHRTSIVFPEEARTKSLSGSVIVNVSVDDKGEVIGAQPVSGPDEFRKAVLQSVANWHFALDPGNSARSFQIAVRFDSPAVALGTHGKSAGSHVADDTPRTVDRVDLSDLPAAVRDKLPQSELPQSGAAVSLKDILALNTSLQNVDSHLRVNGVVHGESVTIIVRLAKPGTTVMPVSRIAEANAVQVGGSLQSSKLISQVQPAYPPVAKQARIQGTVRMSALIGADGHVQNLQVVSGHPLLVPATLEAVRQWVYSPTLVNGQPVAVSTMIDVNFTLSNTPPPAAQ